MLKNNYTILVSHNNEKMFILFKSIVIGLAAGGVSVLYRITLTNAETISNFTYTFLNQNFMFLPITFLFLIGMGYFVGYLVDKNKMISGSGIPQLEGILKGYFKSRKSWMHTLISKFVGGAIAIVAGLSLGREGPSIQLGACIAEGVGNKIGKGRLEKRILMASGASAGLAAAFNAPMAGVIFALEEIFKYFSPIILLSTISAAVTADFISKKVFGMNPVFNFPVSQTVPLNGYLMLIFLGIVLGISGAIYNYTLFKTQKFYKKLTFLNIRTKIIIPFILAGFLGIVFPLATGGGHKIIEYLNLKNGISFLVLILIVKFIFSMLSFASGAPGGIFFPLLILGATIGSIFGHVMIGNGIFDESLFNNFIILAMAGYFTAIVRAPITGIVLIMEMTGSFNHLLSLTVVSITAYIVAELLNSPPVYDKLLDNLIVQEHPEDEKEHINKILVEIIVQHDSVFENSLVKDLHWPGKSLLVAIKRGEVELIPKGDTKIMVGDYLVVLTDINCESKIREKLEKLNLRP